MLIRNCDWSVGVPRPQEQALALEVAEEHSGSAHHNRSAAVFVHSSASVVVCPDQIASAAFRYFLADDVTTSLFQAHFTPHNFI